MRTPGAAQRITDQLAYWDHNRRGEFQTKLTDMLNACPDVSGYVFQWEAEAHVHIQMYIELKKQWRFSRLNTFIRQLPSCDPYICEAHADRYANINYCSKTRTRIPGTEPVISDQTWATRGTQGRRTDLHAATDIIKAGGAIREVAVQTPLAFVRYHKGLLALRDILHFEPRKQQPVYTFFIGGPTGMGKSSGTRLFIQHALNAEGDYFTWSPKSTGSWWEGYAGQKVVVIEEMDAKSMPVSEFLRITDPQGGEIRVAIHGGQVAMLATIFIITSNCTPTDIWADAKAQQMAAVMRRLRSAGGPVTDLEIARIMAHSADCDVWTGHNAPNYRETVDSDLPEGHPDRILRCVNFNLCPNFDESICTCEKWKQRPIEICVLMIRRARSKGVLTPEQAEAAEERCTDAASNLLW